MANPRAAGSEAADLECVVNVSEGRDSTILEGLDAACGPTLLDRHSDPDHHRSVFTLGGPGSAVEAAARALTVRALELVDLGRHAGVHPRFGSVDVVPFVPLGSSDLGRAVRARDRFADWAGRELGLPCFLYGPLPTGGERTLPDLRRQAFGTLQPDRGPARPHPRAGACAVGARHPLVAYNLWLEGADEALARRLAASLRGPAVRALGLQVGEAVQVSCNLVDPATVGPGLVYDAVADELAGTSARIVRAELVGLAPSEVLKSEPEGRWRELGLSPDTTIEARLSRTAASAEKN